MNARSPLLAAVLAAAAVAAPPADAAEPVTTDYVAARVGTYLPLSSKMSAYDAGLDAEVTVGRFFTEFLAAELGAGWLRTSAPNALVGPYPWSNGTGGWTYVPRSESLQVIPVTVGVRAVLPYGNLRPYAVAGAGLYFTRLQLDQSGPPVLGTAASASDSRTLLGIHVGIGATLQLGARAYAGVEGRFTSSRATFFGIDERNIDALRIGALVGFRL